jgi:hypothetical protein
LRDIRRYWREVRELEASLPEFVWLVAVEGSAPVQVGAGRAAQLLLSKSHRMASEDELSIQREKEIGERKARQREARRREGVVMIEVAALPDGG